MFVDAANDIAQTDTPRMEKLPENAKKMNEGVKIYATQLKNSVKR